LGWFTGGAYWLWWKVLAVGGLTVVHGLLERHVAVFSRDEGYQSSKYFRVLNEVPTVLLIVIVILVVLKPF
jgi:putative membrane protein